MNRRCFLHAGVVTSLAAALTLSGCATQDPEAAGVGQSRAPMVAFLAPKLPPPTGRIVMVSDMSGLLAALRIEGRPEPKEPLSSDTTIVLGPGVYRLRAPLLVGLPRAAGHAISRITIRGATGNREDVVLEGSGMYSDTDLIGFEVQNAQDVTIADLSIGDVSQHAVHLKGQEGAARVHLYNLHLFDTGQQIVKADAGYNANQPPTGVDRGIVEYSLIEYSTLGPKSGYTNGIDVHRGGDWIIRYNVFKNIRVPANARQSLGPAVLMWSQSENTATYDNLFWNCERAIAYGLGPQPDKPGVRTSHVGGVIYNNFIYRAAGIRGDAGISAWDAPDVKIMHNTVIQNGTYANAIEYRFPTTTNVTIANNLTDGAITARGGARASLTGNYTAATPRLFRGADIGDLHLLETAKDVIDRGADVDEFRIDWDGDERPAGARRDIGADEYVLSPPEPAVTRGSRPN